MTRSNSSRDDAQAWHDIVCAVSPETRGLVSDMVSRLADQFSDHFYAHMLADEQASRLLDLSVVKERQHAMLARWLRALFDVQATPEQNIAAQRRTGEAHARIGVPIDLVAQGARVLKRSIAAQLARGDVRRDSLAEAIQYVYELLDLAVDTMNASYSANASRMARADEAYRLFFLNQNMKAERERQKSQLLEVAQQILVRYYWDDQGESASHVGQVFRSSQFGLWLHHKASMLFEDAPEIARIEETITVIERDLLPRLTRARASHEDARAVAAAINLQFDEIKLLLGSMFDRFIEVEDGRDTVTRLLNRRYFPSVAKREIALAQASQSVFALLLVDVDGFQRIRETLGMQAADMILSQVADALLDSVRAGDFVFRVGDDRFLVLLVEAVSSSLLPVAEGLRERIAGLSLRTANRAVTSTTVSIGIAVFDGHPDYQRLLDRADAGLRQAKEAGLNRCVLVH